MSAQQQHSLGSWYDDFLALRAAVVRAVAMVWAEADNLNGALKGFTEAFHKSATGAMHDWFGYQCPFDTNLTISSSPSPVTMVNPTDEFLPAYTGGWVGVNNTIELKLPLPPPDQSQWAEALAGYNQMRPFFLTYRSNTDGSGDGNT